MTEVGSEGSPFSGDKIGEVPIEVLQEFGNLMRAVQTEVGAHLADPDGHPLPDGFSDAVSDMAKTGIALVNGMNKGE